MDLINSGSGRFHIDFESNMVAPSALTAGISFLLLMAYYFGAVDFGILGAMEVIFCMILPLFLVAGFMILLKGIHYPVVPAYGIMGGVLCLIAIVRACLFGGTLNIILAFIWYIPTLLVCLGTTFSFLSTRKLMAISFLVAAVVRLVFVDLIGYVLKLQILSALPSIALSFAMMAFGFLALSFEMKTKKRKHLA